MISYICEGCRLIGTIDAAPGKVGILIVSGGNEIRCGAHRGMALLAQRLAAAGVSVFRFDRRGIGDSEGTNGGYATSSPDIAAALAAFLREQPQVERVVGFGNCDAATALLLLANGFDALVLANPWLGDDEAAHPAAALRRHYVRRLVDQAAWRGLLLGGLSRTIKNLMRIFRRDAEQPLTRRFADALRHQPATIVLATGDRTAQVFAAAMPPSEGTRIVRLDTASHSFAGHIDDLERILLDIVQA